MKQIMQFIVYSFLTVLVFSCKKETDDTSIIPPLLSIKPPVAHAGNDTSFMIICSVKASIVLDGSGSYDPDANPISYNWKQIHGIQVLITDQFSPKVTIENLSFGNYAFELTVKNTGGLSSKDTVLVTISENIKEYDLDILINEPYTFTKNYYNPWDYNTSNEYSDVTHISGTAVIIPLGEFKIYITEYADTAELSNFVESYISIAKGNVDPAYISGYCSINFKKLIRHGGGPFNGTFTITAGSAQKCDHNVLSNFAPLSLSGNLDVNTKMVNLHFKGKAPF